MSDSALGKCTSMSALLRRLVEIGNGYRGKDAKCSAERQGRFCIMRDGDTAQMYDATNEYGDLSAFGIEGADYRHISDAWDGFFYEEEDD